MYHLKYYPKNNEFTKRQQLLELPWRSFVGLEPACAATTGNGVAGDLYNSVESGWGVTAERKGTACSSRHRPLPSRLSGSKPAVPGRTHQAAPAFHPAVIRKGSLLAAGATLPLFPQSWIPAVTFHHHLPTGTEWLWRRRRRWPGYVP